MIGEVTTCTNFALKCFSVNARRRGFDAFLKKISVSMPVNLSSRQVENALYLLLAGAEAPILPVPLNCKSCRE